jgi:fimbrial chaperone protein
MNTLLVRAQMARHSSLRASFAGLALCVLTVFSLWPAAVQAGSFSVTPVRIYMTPRDRAVAVTLVNEGDTPVALQADINVWTQKPDGTDELVLTEDLVLSPPIIKLAPQARQVVRLALLKPADASRQLTYRLIVREVPEATAPPSAGLQVPIALALSMPVFITPPVAKREMACTLASTAPTTQAAASSDIAVSCANAGSAYAQVREATLKRGDTTLASFEGGTYILPGARKSMALKLQGARTSGPATLTVTYDDSKSDSFAVTLP